jgi:hypothetical protein
LLGGTRGGGKNIKIVMQRGCELGTSGSVADCCECGHVYVVVSEDKHVSP